MTPLDWAWSKSTTCNSRSSKDKNMKTGTFLFTRVTWLRSRVATFPIALLLFASAGVASAQTIWTDASGDWFNPANWSAGVPNSSTDAQITNSGTAQIGSAGATAPNLYLGFNGVDSGNLLVSGSGTLRNSSLLAVGHSGSGKVTVQNGGTLSHPFGNIGNLAGSNGTVLVEGTGSRWTTDGYFNVGYSGTGVLTIRNGGAVSSTFGWVGYNSGSNGVVLVDGVGSVWTGSSGIEVGSKGTGSLTIQNGGTVSGVAIIGNYFGHGVVLVDGPNSSLTTADRLIVGYSAGGSGTLTIQNGAAVSDVEGFIGWPSGSEGTVLVDGAGSTWTCSLSVSIGGSLTIQNGGAVFAGHFAGYGSSGGSGVVDGPGSPRSNKVGSSSGQSITLVDGPGSILSVGNGLGVGGTFTTQNGGTVTSDAGFTFTIRNGGTVITGGSGVDGTHTAVIDGGGVEGTTVIDGVGSTWRNYGQFAVGFTGAGNLTIRNGGRLSSSGRGSLGEYSTGDATVLVDGAGSTWNNDGARLDVGFFGLGRLNITNGGTVTSLDSGIGVGETSDGRVTVDGVSSAWNISTALYVGGGNRGNGGQPGNAGLVQIINNGRINSMTTTIFRRGVIIDNALLASQNVSIEEGLLSGSGMVSGNVANAGHIKPGDPIGSLTIAGNYTQLSNGTLTLDVAGIDPNASDHLDISGNATIDGTLQVRFVNGFLPLSGQVFKLINVGGAFTGSFAHIIFPNLRPGFQFNAEFVNGSYQITALNNGVAATGFLNISTRLRVGTGDNALIGGFIITGSVSKRVIIRAIGPSLASLPARLADPTLELRDSAGGLIFSNDNWVDSPQRQQIIDSGIPPSNDHEAAIIATLAPGSYTAVMRGAGNTTGIGVVEVYDLAQEVSAKLANISSRGFVELGDNVMIGGFIVDNQAARVMVRAIGPSLTQSGITNALADPTLELHNGDGAIIAFNNDWRDTDEAAIAGTGIPPANNKESAILTTLAPGPYTAIVRGRNDITGVGLVEFYNLQ